MYMLQRTLVTILSIMGDTYVLMNPILVEQSLLREYHYFHLNETAIFLTLTSEHNRYFANTYNQKGL